MPVLPSTTFEVVAVTPVDQLADEDRSSIEEKLRGDRDRARAVEARPEHAGRGPIPIYEPPPGRLALYRLQALAAPPEQQVEVVCAYDEAIGPGSVVQIGDRGGSRAAMQTVSVSDGAVTGNRTIYFAQSVRRLGAA